MRNKIYTEIAEYNSSLLFSFCTEIVHLKGTHRDLLVNNFQNRAPPPFWHANGSVKMGNDRLVPCTPPHLL